MHLDLRMTTLDRLDEILDSPATTISIGHEGCPHKLPSVTDLRRAGERIRLCGKQFAFIAPILHERYSRAVLDLINSLLDDGSITLIVNDFGLLFGLLDDGVDLSRTELAAGHGLSYSFEQQPWFDLTMESEPSSVRELFYQNSLHDPHLWPHLQAWGFRTIEVDALPQAHRSYQAFRDAGFHLNVLLDVTPIAYARSCHTARYYHATIPECPPLCDRPFELTTTHRWRLYHNQLESISRSTRAQIPEFLVYGNIVYRQVVTDTLFLSDQTTYALDIRHYTPDTLRERITWLRTQLTTMTPCDAHPHEARTHGF